MRKRSRLPKRIIQKQRDQLFVENLILKMQIAMQSLQYQITLESRPKESLGGGVVGNSDAEISLNTDKIKEVIDIAKVGPEKYEAKITVAQ